MSNFIIIIISVNINNNNNNSVFNNSYLKDRFQKKKSTQTKTNPGYMYNLGNNNLTGAIKRRKNISICVYKTYIDNGQRYNLAISN